MNKYNVHAKPFNPKEALKDEGNDEKLHRHPHPMHHIPWYPPHPHPHPYYTHMPVLVSRVPQNPKIEILEPKKITREIGTQTETIKEESEVKEHFDSYPIPKGYNTEEATLWKKICPSAKLARVDNTLCVGEPDDLTFVRMNMIQYKFKLMKEIITDNTYYIKSVRTPETNPLFMDFQIYYRNDNQMPYKTYIRLKNMTKIQEYDVLHNCRLTSKITIPKGKKKIYKQTLDYVKKQKLLEVTDSETHEVLYTDILKGECWFENDFNYRN